MFFYAYFEKNDKVIYYDNNGGTGGPDTGYGYGDKLYISKIEPTRAGYIFTGWNYNATKESYEADYAEANYYPGQVVKSVDYGKTLYANWVNENDYYIVDLYNYDRPNGITKHCLVGKKGLDYVTLPFSLGIEPEQIEGWYSSPTFGEPRYEPATSYTPTGNSKLYAKWKSVDVDYVTIKYDLNYYNCPKDAIPDSKMYYGIDLEIPDIWPQRVGYVFLGWSTDPSDLSGSYPGEKVGLLFENQTLYACWTEVSSLGVRDHLKSYLGIDHFSAIFPDEYFIKARSPKWVYVSSKNAYVCLKTDEVYYGDEKIRKNYITDVFVFGIDEKDVIFVEDFAGFEIQFNPFNLMADILIHELVIHSKNNDAAKGILITASAIKTVIKILVNIFLGYITSDIGKGEKIIFDALSLVYSIIQVFVESDLSTEEGREAFCKEMQDLTNSVPLSADLLLQIANLFYDALINGRINKEALDKFLGGSISAMSDYGVPILEFIADMIKLVMTDKRYAGLDPYGDKDFAIGRVIDRMEEKGFGEGACKAAQDLIVSLYQINNAKRIYVKCPVDVKVYNANGDLLGYIKDDVPQLIEDSGMFTYVDENGHKCVVMNKTRQYTMEIIATDDGEVSVIVETEDISTGELSEIKTYSTMNVKKGDVINVDVMPTVDHETPAEDGCKAETPVKLVINDGEEVEPTVVQKGTQIVTYNVTAGSSNAEAGTVTGGGSFYNGEFCKVTAEAKDGYEFKGWMEDGKLVSSDAEYRFEINTDHNIVAEFAKKGTTEGGNSGSGNSGSGNSGSGNSGGGSSGGSSGGYSGGGSSGGSSGGYSGGGSSGGYSGGGSSGGYSGGGSSGGVSGGGSSGGSSGGVSGGSTGGTTGGGTSGGTTGGGTTGTGNTGNGGSGKTDGKDGDTSKEFELKVGAVYTDENGIRYSITAIKGTKKATANTVKYIGPEKSSVKKIVIPDTVTIEGTTYTVTELDTSWTKGNKKLTTVVINDNIKKIPTDAFNGCKALKSITFGAKVTTIGTRAFYNCAKLKTVKLPAKLTKIGSKAFYGCSALEGITIPSMVESISSYAFYRCRKLYKVTIKSKHLTDKKIGKKAFAGIVTNAVIKVPKSVLDKYTEMLKKAGVTKNMTVTK